MGKTEPIRICIFAPDLHDPVAQSLLSGINSKLEENNVEIDIISAGYISDRIDIDAENIYLYEEIIKRNYYHGLIIFAGSFTNFTTTETAAEYLKFIPEDLPVICLSIEIPGFDYLEVDNFEPIKDMVTHLVKKHNKKRFCFIKGPEEHKEADQRYKGFLKGLEINDIKLDESLIFEGSYIPFSGSEAIQKIIDKKIEFPDAIICADDDTATGVYSKFKKLNINIEEEGIAVTGFDNIKFTESMEPKLTTVDQSLYRQGQMALELLIKKVRNEKVGNETLKPKNIYRASCGCVKSASADENLNLIYNNKIPELNKHKIDIERIFNKFIQDENFGLKLNLENYIDYYIKNEYSLITLSEIVTCLSNKYALKVDSKKLHMLYNITQKINNKIISSIDSINDKKVRYDHDLRSELTQEVVEISRSYNFKELLEALKRDYYYIRIKSIEIEFPNCQNKDLKAITNRIFLKDKHLSIKDEEFFTIYYPISSKNDKGFAIMEVASNSFGIAEVVVFQISRTINAIELFSELELKIDELQSSYDSLRQTKDLLLESEKLAKLGGFVSHFTHEINTPIGISVTAITHLQESVKQLKTNFRNGRLTKTELTRHIENTENVISMINKNLERTTSLIRGFKQIAVDQSSEIVREFNLKSYIEEIIHSLTPVLKKTAHEIDLDIDPNLLINSLPGIFSQIFTNLIQNSLIHGFENIKNGKIEINATQEENNLLIVYNDNGCGVSKKTLEKMFESYYSTKIGKGGSGLGMTIIKKLITEELNGEISCSSKLGNGVTFTITLPADLIVK